MKKCTLFVAAMVLFAAASWAGGLRLAGVAQNQVPIKKQCSLSQRIAQSGEGVLALKKAAKPMADVGTVISDAPAGTVYENMYVNSEAYGLGWGDAYYQKVDGGLGGVDVANDGFIYVQAPISQAYIWGLGSPWLKCEKKEGDVIVMHLPQLYCIDAGDPYYAQRLVPSANGKTFVVDSTTQDVKFTWKDNKLTQVDDCLVGLCDATGGWFYMGDFNIKYTINPDKPIVKPEGLTKATCKMEYKSDAKDLTAEKFVMVNVFNADGKVYVDHMEKGLPDAVMCGTVSADGKSVEVPAKQYLGIDLEYNAHVYVLTGNAKIDGAGTEKPFFNYDKTASIKLTRDASGKMAAEYPASLVVNCGRENLYIISDYVAPRFVPQEDKAMTPADPVFTADDIRPSTNFDLVKFVLPVKDVDGNDLNVNELYYNVYYNDAPYVFTPEVFKGLTAPMTDIPYAFSDTEFDIYPSGGKHTIYFYDKNYTKLGVQSIYRGGGEERRSNVVWVNRPVTGIDDVNADMREVKSVSYYNVAGQQIAEPTSGVCIKRIQYADGTVKAEKVIK